MNTSSFNYLFGIDGNFTVRMEEMNRATGEFTAQVQKSQNTFERIIGLAGKIDILSDGIIKGTQAKLILGQLSPELAKSPVALKAMGEHVATLSKLMGGDATAAAEVLNTAMNQYGVDLSDPIKQMHYCSIRGSYALQTQTTRASCSTMTNS